MLAGTTWLYMIVHLYVCRYNMVVHFYSHDTWKEMLTDALEEAQSEAPDTSKAAKVRESVSGAQSAHSQSIVWSGA